MKLSVLITSLPFSFDASLRELVKLGFGHVDLVGSANRSEQERAALADSGLIVDCVALGRELPDGCALDADDLASRRRAVQTVEQQIADAAQLGARVAYVVPCKTEASLPAFADSCGVLSAYASRRMVQLCVEHFPGTALPTAAGALAWLQTASLDNVKLVLDVGHCLISLEDPAQVAAQAGRRLGYVQLDDNDGVGDLHWPLLTGVLTESMLRALRDGLREAGYRSGVALELKGSLHEPVGNVATSKEIVERIWSAH